jgi:hypothetical protein
LHKNFSGKFSKTFVTVIETVYNINGEEVEIAIVQNGLKKKST